MAWLQIAVAAPRERVEAVSECLEAHGAVAQSLSGVAGGELLEPAPGEQPLWEEVRVEVLLEPDADLAGLRATLASLGAGVVDVAFLGEDDWESRWRAHAVRARFGRLWLLPRDEPVDSSLEGRESAVVLRLDPGLAFGSGSHPTTRLCLAALAEMPLEGREVLDFGCGSGVLALAACLLGARRVVAVDHDPQALLATRENATYNQIGADRLEVMAPEAFTGRDTCETRRFDVVVANILANPLVALAPLLSGSMARGGRLLLSGILESQEDTVRAAYPSLAFDVARREGEWICLEGRSKDRR